MLDQYEPNVGTQAVPSWLDRVSGGRWPMDFLMVIAVATLVFFTNLGGAGLWDRDEPRNAGCALEMMQRGDWVTPIFNDEIRGQKPALLYWLIMSAYQVFGVNEFSARFWSAFLGVGTVGLTYCLGRRLFNRQVGFWSAIALSTTIMFTVASRAATPDAPLVFFSTLALTLYVLLTFKAPETIDGESQPLPKRLTVPGRWFPVGLKALPIYIAMAVGVLAKGPIAVVLPTMIIGLFLLIQTRTHSKRSLLTGGGLSPNSQPTRSLMGRGIDLATDLFAVFHPVHFLKTTWSMQPWLIVLCVAVISFPWFAWVGFRTEGDFLKLFFFKEHLGRATVAMENHSGGLWFYPTTILVGFFPWSVLSVPIGISIYRCFSMSDSAKGQANSTSRSASQVDWRSGLSFGLVWVLLQVSVFSMVQTKLPSYITPCYPAIALLVGVTLERMSRGVLLAGPLLVRGSFICLSVVGMLLIAAFVLIFQQMQLPVKLLPILGLIPLITGIAAWLVANRSKFQAVPSCLAAGAILFCVGLFGYGTMAVDSNRQSGQLWDYLQKNQSQTSKLATYRCLESSWVFYAQQPIWELDPEATVPAQFDVSVVSLEQAMDSQMPQFAMGFESTTGQKDGKAGADRINVGQPPDPLLRARAWHPKPRPAVGEFLVAHPESFIVTPEAHLAELMERLPPGYGQLQRCRDFLKQSDLVLVGPLPKD